MLLAQSHRIAAVPFVLSFQLDGTVVYNQDYIVDSQQYRRLVDSNFFGERLWNAIKLTLSIKYNNSHCKKIHENGKHDDPAATMDIDHGGDDDGDGDGDDDDDEDYEDDIILKRRQPKPTHSGIDWCWHHHTQPETPQSRHGHAQHQDREQKQHQQARQQPEHRGTRSNPVRASVRRASDVSTPLHGQRLMVPIGPQDKIEIPPVRTLQVILQTTAAAAGIFCSF